MLRYMIRRLRPRLVLLLVPVAMLFGCQDTGSGPNSVTEPVIELKGQAFLFNINVTTGEITVSHPHAVAPSSGGPTGPSLSLLNDDAIGVTTSNFFRSTKGQFIPNKVRIRFDVVLRNKLSVTDLITPTFPTPPAGVTGILMFPFTAMTTGTQSGIAVPSTDWDGTHIAGSGAPYNFFNDFNCTTAGGNSDCYRWEAFSAPLLPGTSTVAQTVGFDVAPNATNVQAYIVVAADLHDNPQGAQSGAIAGHVTSPQAGALPSVTVTATGQAPATTDITGGYQVTEVPVGSTSLALTNLPTGCTDPGPQSATVQSGGITMVDFSVTCPAPSGSTGTVVGTVTSPSLGNLYGVTVVVNPGNKGAATDGAGGFTIPGVPAGQVVVTISNLPTGCINPGTLGVTVVAGGGTGANFSVSCSGAGGTTGTLTGTVNGNAFGIPGVTATLQPGDLKARTDPQGIFAFTDLPAGTFLVSISPLAQGCQPIGIQAVGIVAGQSAAINLNTACAPASIAIAAGDHQTAPYGAQLPINPAVIVTDGYNNPVAGVPVTFAVTGGGGSIISGATSFTDGSGIAAAEWQLGPLPGPGFLVPNTLTATAAAGNIAGNGLTFSANVDGNTWRTATSMSVPRSYAGSGVINDILYVVGGSDEGSQFVGTLEAYDPATDTWTTLAPMPTPRAFLAAGVINGILYAVGGVNESGTVFNTVEAYDPATDTWTTKAPLNTPRYALGVGVVNGILYAVGGTNDSGRLDVLEAYDPLANNWKTKAGMPTRRAYLSVEVVNGALYAVGGQDETLLTVDAVEAYDRGSDTWTTKQTLPAPRYALGAGELGGLLYTLGGGDENNSLVGTVQAYDPTTNGWIPKSAMPAPRAGMSVGVIGGILYAVGGQGGFALAVGTVEAYQP